MSDTFARATTVFRDAINPDDPYSHPYEPFKSEVRALHAIQAAWAEGWVSNIVNEPTSDELPGERYIVGASPTGVFVNSPNCLAILIDDVWNFADPSEGAQLYNRAYDRQHKFDGTSWRVIPSTSDALQKAANLSDIANPSAARTNLSAAASGANTDISFLLGLARTSPGVAPSSGINLTDPATGIVYALNPTSLAWAPIHGSLAAASSAAALDAACASAGITWRLDASLTLGADSNFTALVEWAGGKFDLNGHNLTLGGGFDAPPQVQIFDVSAGGTLTAPLPPRIFAEWFGAKGDGTTDDSALINAALTFAGSGNKGTVQLGAKTYVGNITVPGGVTLTGVAEGYGYVPSNPSFQTTIKAAGPGVVVDTATGTHGTLHGTNLCNFNVLGLGAGTPLVGVRVREGNYYFSVKNIHVHNTADQAVLSESGSQAGTFTNLLAIGLINQNRSQIAAACEIHGNDHQGSFIEAGCGQSAFSDNYNLSTPLFTAGVWFDAATDFNFFSITGESSDTGIYVTGSSSTYVALRPNFNIGHGMIDASSGTVYTGTRILNNGRAAASTYDGFYKFSSSLVAGSGLILLNGMQYYVPGGTNAGRYAINDNATYGGLLGGAQSVYSNVLVSGTYSGQTYNFADAFIGPRVTIAPGGDLILTVNSATPSVDNYVSFRTANTSATTITNFTNGVNGQEVTVLLDDTNTTIASGSTIKTSGSTNITAKGEYKFKKYNGVWRQTAGVAF